MLWRWNGASWDTLLDVSSHGHVTGTVEQLSLGSHQGKGGPSSGGPFYMSAVCVNTPLETPTHTPVGHVEVKAKVPNGAGTDNGFDVGGAPSYLDVDERPNDGDTTYDEGDAAGEKQSYADQNADGGDVPLAFNINGAWRRTGSAANAKGYVYDGATRDYGQGFGATSTAYLGIQGPSGGRTYNRVNGAVLTEALFNSLEVGLEIVSVTGAVRLSNIGLEYAIENKALPSDYPDVTPPAPGGDDRRRALAEG